MTAGLILLAFGCALGIAGTIWVQSIIVDFREHRRDRQIDKATELMLEELRAYEMTDKEREAQRRSFVFGNLKIDRPELTEEEFNRIIEAATKCTRHMRHRCDECFPMSYATKNPGDPK